VAHCATRALQSDISYNRLVFHFSFYLSIDHLNYRPLVRLPPPTLSYALQIPRGGARGGGVLVLGVEAAGVLAADALMQHAQREQGAALARRPDFHAQHLEDIIRLEGAQVVQRRALDALRQHRGGRLTDGAAPPGEAHLRHLIAFQPQVNLHTVAAERVGVAGVDVWVVQMAVVARLAIVLQDVLAVEVVQLRPALSSVAREGGRLQVRRGQPVHAQRE
jgi:hypothetical protein